MTSGWPKPKIEIFHEYLHVQTVVQSSTLLRHICWKDIKSWHLSQRHIFYSPQKRRIYFSLPWRVRKSYSMYEYKYNRQSKFQLIHKRSPVHSMFMDEWFARPTAPRLVDTSLVLTGSCIVRSLESSNVLVARFMILYKILFDSQKYLGTCDSVRVFLICDSLWALKTRAHDTKIKGWREMEILHEFLLVLLFPSRNNKPLSFIPS